MAHIAAFIFRAAVGWQFDIVNFVIRRVVAVFKTHIVEHKEFGLWADIDSVANARGLQIGFGALGGRTRVATVQLASRWFNNVAEDDHHRRSREWINIYGVQIRLQDHVGFIDRFPAFNRRAVEHQTVFQLIFANNACAHCQMLPFALGVSEAHIDPLDFLILNAFDDVFG